MREKKKKSFYSLAKYPTYEILMESQMASAGAHQAKFVEKLKKNKNYIKHQSWVLKIVFSFLFLLLPLLPLVTYFQIADNIGIYTISTIFFVSSFLFMIFFGMTLMYMLMFGMLSTGSFMSGNAFKWLQTLPFSKKSLKKIGFMALFRNLDIPIIVLTVGFPIIMLIATQDITMFFICLVTSIVNVVSSFSILVIVGEKISFLFSESKMKSKNANIIRTVTMLGYFIIMFGSSFIFSWGISAVDSFFVAFATNEPPSILIIILSLIPFLFAPAFLVSLNSLQYQVQPIFILTTITGFVLTIILTWFIFKIAQRALRSAISSEIKIEKVEKREIQFELKPTSPIKAYLRKDLVSSIRDIQSFMFLFFPIVYPLIMILSMSGLFNDITISLETILMILSIILILYLFIPIMLIVGFLNLEESGSSTIASLPVIPRDQAKAKIILMLSLQGISLIITSLVLTLLLQSVEVLILLLITLPIAWTFLLFMFVLKIKLFGQMKYKYIIEELQKENKILKWAAMLLSAIGLYIAILLTGNILIYFFGLIIALIVLGVIGILGLALMAFIFDRMFPKVEKMAVYKTGGFLRDHINVATLVLLILSFLISFLPSIIEIPFLLILLQQPIIIFLFIDFILSMASLALLWLLIVPSGLRLPKKESFKNYSQTIGLSSVKPFWRNFLIGIGTIIIYGLSCSLLATFLGIWIFDLNILFGEPAIFNFGWFLFILMLIPGIWEEVAFRGVILNLQLKKYSQTASIILNGLIFGLFHFVNLLFGQNLYNTTMQVIYASCLGISFSYMYVKTKSLIPSIIAHYLIDSVGQLFSTVTSSSFINLTIFTIVGVGIIPMIFTIILVKIIIRNKKDFREISL